MTKDGSVVVDTELNNDGFNKGIDSMKGGFSKIKSIAGTALKGIAIGAAAVTTGMIAIGKSAVDSYADYEQLIGGVETLFKESAGIVEGYANNAYKTAGLSANAYMDTVTSFSASLLQSLNGDTAKSAQVADMAITDMADNANKMGTSMESIQNAYQGFAKQNYTMLDNLKLGYGGTKEEMERLLSDAQKITGVKYDISNLNDVYQAIHVIQGELGITGTTAKEASTTIQGSAAAMKGAWQNLLTGMADDSQDFGQLIENFVESVLTFGDNIIPRIEVVINGISKLVGGLVQEFLPKIIQMIPPLLEEALPIILTALQSLVQSILDALPAIMQCLIDVIPQLIDTITAMLPLLVDVGMQIIICLIQGLVDAIPNLIIELVQLVNQIIGVLIDNLPDLIDAAISFFMGIVEAIPEIITALLDNLDEIIKTVVYGLIDALPRLIEGAIQLFMGIIQAIPTIIDALIDNLPHIIETILEALIDAIPAIIDGAIQLFMGLIQALPTIIEALIENLPRIILTITSVLIQNLPRLIQAAIQLFMGIIKAIPTIVIELARNMPQIIASIVNGLKAGFSQVKEIGSNMIKGLWEGINNVKQWIFDKIKGFCSGIIDKVKGLFGIHSPSKVFNKEVGQYLGLGLGEGFNDSLKDVYKDMQRAVEHENTKLTSNLTSSHQIKVETEDNRQTHLQSIDDNKEITVNSVTNLDGKVLTSSVNKGNIKRKLQYGY